MRRSITLALFALAACHPGPPSAPQATATPTAQMQLAAPQQVQLKAVDGRTVFGTFYPVDSPRAVILLFHQAGSSSGEYADIAPRLQREGYASLAIDARIGGGMYGVNRTMAPGSDASDKEGGDPDYLSALPDMEAALAWGKAKAAGAPVVLWGSSYSASLVFLLAASSADRDAVKAILAFSPGEYFSDKAMVARAAARVRVPVFATAANAIEEQDEAKAVVRATQSLDRQYYEPATGIHGSSTLNATKNPGGADENWRVVLGFLKRIFP